MSLGDDLDLAGGQVGVGVALGPPADLAGHLDDVLVAQVVRLALGEDLVPDHHLGDPGRVAQVEERHAAVIAPTGHPPGQRDGLSGGVGTQGAGLVSAKHGDVLFGVDARIAPPSYGTPPAAPNRSCPDVPPCLAPPRVGEHLLEAPRAASGNRTARGRSAVRRPAWPWAPSSRRCHGRRGHGRGVPGTAGRRTAPAGRGSARGVEPLHLLGGELELGRGGRVARGLGPRRARDRDDHRRGRQHPRQGDLLRADPAGVGDLLERREGGAQLAGLADPARAGTTAGRRCPSRRTAAAPARCCGRPASTGSARSRAGRRAPPGRGGSAPGRRWRCPPWRSCPRRAARRGCPPTPRTARRRCPDGAAGRARSPRRRGASATPRTPHAGAPASCRWSRSRRPGAGARPWWPRGPRRRRRPRSAAPRR